MATLKTNTAVVKLKASSPTARTMTKKVNKSGRS